MQPGGAWTTSRSFPVWALSMAISYTVAYGENWRRWYFTNKSCNMSNQPEFSSSNNGSDILQAGSGCYRVICFEIWRYEIFDIDTACGKPVIQTISKWIGTMVFQLYNTTDATHAKYIRIFVVRLNLRRFQTSSRSCITPESKAMRRRHPGIEFVSVQNL